MIFKNLFLNYIITVLGAALILGLIGYGGYRFVHQAVREYDNTMNVTETNDRIKKYCIGDTIVYEHLDSHSITTAGQLCVK